MLTAIITLAAFGAAGLLTAFLTLKSPALRRVLKPMYRRLAYRIVTAIGRNYSGIDGTRWSQTVAIARTQRNLRQSCRVLETDAGMLLVDTPLGGFWIPEPDREAYDGFLLMVAEELNNHYHFEGAAYVLDCGANLGTFTRLALSRGARVVVAIEPARDLARCLRKTFAHEILLGQVILEEKGLWDKDDRLFLRTSENSWNNTITTYQGGQRGVWVQLTTIDKIVVDLGLPSVNFIKMDIEGAEVRAIEGAKTTLLRWKPVISVATEHTEEKLKNAATVVALAKEFGPYSDVCIKGSIMTTRSILGVRLPSSVMPEIMLLRQSFPPAT